MNIGIVRSALTATLFLELEYRDPSSLRELKNESGSTVERQCPVQLSEEDVATSCVQRK